MVVVELGPVSMGAGRCMWAGGGGEAWASERRGWGCMQAGGSIGRELSGGRSWPGEHRGWGMHAGWHQCPEGVQWNRGWGQ